MAAKAKGKRKQRVKQGSGMMLLGRDGRWRRIEFPDEPIRELLPDGRLVKFKASRKR